MDVIASYKNFKVVVRHKSEWIPVATVGVTLEVKWLGYPIVNVRVREAMEAFMQDLEYGCLSTLLNKGKVVRVTGDATNDAVYVPWGQLHRKNYLQSTRAESRFEDLCKELVAAARFGPDIWSHYCWREAISTLVSEACNLVMTCVLWAGGVLAAGAIAGCI